MQADAPAPEQVMQLGSQLEQEMLAVAVHAALSYDPAGQLVEQAKHFPPLRYFPPPHEVQAEGPAPEQLAQLESQMAQTVLAVPVQAELTY